MTISRLLGVAAASLMAVTPVMANAQTAQSAASRLSLSQSDALPARAGAKLGAQSKLGGNSLWIVGALAMIGGVVWAITEDNDNDNPASN